MSRINRIEQKIHTYKERKKELKNRFDRKSDDYKINLHLLSAKVKGWQAQLRRLRKTKASTEKIAKIVKEFTGVNVKNSGTNPHKDKNLSKARKLFFKYSLENGLKGGLLSEYVGITSRNYPSIQRRKFTRSFKTNPENKEYWNKFKEFVKNESL